MAELQGAGRGAITLAGFNFANVNERVRLAKPSYVSIYETLGKAAKQLEHVQPAVWRVLALLSQLASMALTAATFNEPFAPLLRWNGGRSVGLDDFTDEEIDSLPLIVDAIESSLLKARVLDVLWLRRRNMPSAIAAIDCYLTIELDGLVWAGGGQQCWKRGVQLAATLKTQACSSEPSITAAPTCRFSQIICRKLSKNLRSSKGLVLNSNPFFKNMLATMDTKTMRFPWRSPIWRPTITMLSLAI